MDTIDPELEEAITLDSFLYQKEEGQQIFIDTVESQAAMKQKNIEKLMKMIRSSRMTEFKQVRKGICFYLDYTDVGKKFLYSLKDHDIEVERYFPMHKFNPLVALYVKLIKQSRLDSMIDHMSMSQFYSETELSLWVSRLNTLVDGLRTAMRSVDFIAQTKNYFRRGMMNFKSANQLQNMLFERHSKLLVVRIDLRYDMPIRNGEASYGQFEPISIDETIRHRKAFFRQIYSHPMCRHLLGWCWKLEYGYIRGYHYHVIFFFNGAKVQSDQLFAKALGEFWKKEITESKGSYHNCNVDKNSYKHCGIGMIHRNDIESDLT